MASEGKLTNPVCVTEHCCKCSLEGQ